jgi:hypothetical protein
VDDVIAQERLADAVEKITLIDLECLISNT